MKILPRLNNNYAKQLATKRPILAPVEGCCPILTKLSKGTIEKRLFYIIFLTSRKPHDHCLSFSLAVQLYSGDKTSLHVL